jgi:hypothetical protein
MVSQCELACGGATAYRVIRSKIRAIPLKITHETTFHD